MDSRSSAEKPRTFWLGGAELPRCLHSFVSSSFPWRHERVNFFAKAMLCLAEMKSENNPDWLGTVFCGKLWLEFSGAFKNACRRNPQRMQ
jgi:hypothetical protein